MMNEKRFFVGADGSCHKYLVPLEKRKEWEEWCNLDESDERSWEAPEYAEMIEGHLLTFTKPEFV